MGSTGFSFLQVVQVSKYRIAGVLRGANFFVEPFTCFNFLAHYVSVYPVLKTLRY